MQVRSIPIKFLFLIIFFTYLLFSFLGFITLGTVEYLYNAASNKYYFLELNPRLQVEHPVTEGLTGTNLPSIQLQVAMGIALDRIPEIRTFYGRSPFGVDKIDFLKDEYVYPQRHVIAARITAENPDEGFKPTSGRIERVKFQSTPKVWGYFSVGANGGIHEYADSQFGHVFASGATREEARKSLVMALKEIDVRGDIRTTVEYLIKLLETQEFKDNTIDTSWLDGIIREKSVSTALDPDVVALSAAIYKAHTVVSQQKKDIADALSKGQTGLQNMQGLLSFPVEVTFDNVKYSFTAVSKGPGLYVLSINGQNIEVRIREQPDKSLLCSISGDTNYQLFGQEEALGLRLKVNGVTVLIPTVFNPSELRSDVTGKVVRFLQQDGAVVEKDKPYVEVEAMKMIMALKASESGVISHNLSPGSILSAGDLIASLKLKDPSRVKQIKPFKEILKIAPAQPAPPSVEEASERLSLAMDGYNHDISALATTVTSGAKADLEGTLNFYISQLRKFVDTEIVFAGKEESSVVSTLAKASKDNMQNLIPQLLARKQTKQRIAAVLMVLREIESLPGILFSSDSKVTLSPALSDILTGLSKLDGQVYGEVALKARQLIETAQTPPFQSRLDSLKAAVLAAGADLNKLALQPNMAVSVDLLTVLMSDKDAAVRRAAMETYLRRVYRAHVIKNMVIKDNNGVMSASWSFTVRDTSDLSTPVRHGYMTVLPDSDAIEKSLSEVIAESAAVLPKGTSSEPLNVVHIGFSRSAIVGNEFAAKAQAALGNYKAQLSAMNVRTVNFFLSNPGKIVSYFNYYAETGFAEDPISRNMRPTMPQLLEINRLSENFELERMVAVGRNAYMYLGKEKVNPAAGKIKGDRQQVLYLRAISLSEESISDEGADRVLNMALEEIERAILDSRITDTTSSRVFLNILPDAKMSLDDSVSAYKKIMDSKFFFEKFVYYFI